MKGLLQYYTNVIFLVFIGVFMANTWFER